MDDLTIFIVQNQNFVFAILGFVVFVYFARFFVMLVQTIFNAKKGLKLGRIGKL